MLCCKGKLDLGELSVVVIVLRLEWIVLILSLRYFV